MKRIILITGLALILLSCKKYRTCDCVVVSYVFENSAKNREECRSFNATDMQGNPKPCKVK